MTKKNTQAIIDANSSTVDALETFLKFYARMREATNDPLMDVEVISALGIVIAITLSGMPDKDRASRMLTATIGALREASGVEERLN